MIFELYQLLKKNYGIWLTTFLVTFLVGLIRISGSLQILELSALDFLFVHRSAKTLDSKIVIVKITEKDLQKLKEYPLSDLTLTKLLTKIKQQEPRVIGLNIFRDFPVASVSLDHQQNEQAYQELLDIFKNTNNLFGIEKVTHDSFSSQIEAPSVLKQQQRTTSADVVVDFDGVVRRGILFPVTDGSEVSTIPSMGLALALNYLAQENIKPIKDQDGWLQLKDTVFLPFKPNDGGYINADNGGYQILINWHNQKKNFLQVTVSDVLNNNLKADFFRDRVVLIGTTAVSVNDVFYVPYLQDNQKNNQSNPAGLYGVEIQAHLANYIIDAVLEDKPLIKVFTKPGEYIWLAANIFVIALWGWNQRHYRKPLKLLLIIFSGTLVYIFFLIGFTYLVFLQGWWIPIVPTLLGICLAAITIKTCIYVDKLQKANLDLENQVAERTKELKTKNTLLQLAIKKIEETQSQLIAKEKLATLGRISAGISHEIRNPLNLINLNAQLLFQYHQNLVKKIEENKCFFEEAIAELFNDKNDIVWLSEKIDIIQTQVKRGEKIVQDVLFYSPSHNLEFTLVKLKNFIEETTVLVQQEQNIDSFYIEPLIEINTEKEDLAIELIIHDFRRALINILQNAYDSLQDKKNLNSNFEPIISITIKETNSLIKIIIRDNGQGIAEEKLENIFLPFYTQKRAGKGTGLGLFLAREIIVGEHQGTIDVKTKFHEYCQFTISLPKTRKIKTN